MRSRSSPVVGVDVGGTNKGFHAVALRDGRFFEAKSEKCPAVIARWCLDMGAAIVAVDAPCAWSCCGFSRLSERSLKVGGETIQCFKTPTRERAAANVKGFYEWVFNGERLYSELTKDYSLFDGQLSEGQGFAETFPHAVACALAGKVVAAKPKSATRRRLLREQGYDDSLLRNVDFVDAGLCALTARAILEGRYEAVGDKQEGFIVLPRMR
jgi:predicted RNase H-like nuclease